MSTGIYINFAIRRLTEIVEGVKHDLKGLEKGDIKLWILDICVTRFKNTFRIKLLCDLLRDLPSDDPSKEITRALDFLM